MARKAVQAMSLEELEREQEQFKQQRSELVSKVKKLKVRIAEPDLDPSLSFEVAVAAIADTDAELRAAEALLVPVDKQVAAIAAVIAERKREEREREAEALRPAELEAKKRVVAAYLAFVGALSEAHDVERQLRRMMAPSVLGEMATDDLRKALRRQAGRMHHFLGDLAADVPGSPLW